MKKICRALTRIPAFMSPRKICSSPAKIANETMQFSSDKIPIIWDRTPRLFTSINIEMKIPAEEIRSRSRWAVDMVANALVSIDKFKYKIAAIAKSVIGVFR